MGNDDFVQVFHGGGGTVRAEFLAAALDQEGIPSVTSSDSGVAGHPFRVGPMSEFQIQVRREHAERARRIIERISESLG